MRPILLILLILLTAGSLLPQQASVDIRIRAVGDIMLGSLDPPGFLRPAEKGSILTFIRPELLDADLTIGNLEGTLCDSGVTRKCDPDSLDCYVFRMPEKEIDTLKWAGFDLLSLANNHVGDFEESCLARTEYLLDSVRIGWSGRPGTYASRNIQGVDVAFVAFHSGGYCNSSLDLEAAKNMIASLSVEHEIVIVSVHGGAEGLGAMHLPDSMETYLGEERGELIKFSHAVVDAGADLVFGHGPHVARAMEMYRGKIIAYSLGNFATYGRFNLLAARRFGGILEVTMDAQGDFKSGQIISIEQKYWGVPFVDPDGRFSQLVDSLSRADIPSSNLNITPSGKITIR